MAVDGGCQGLGQDVKNVALLLGELFALLHVLSCRSKFGDDTTSSGAQLRVKQQKNYAINHAIP